MRLVSTVNGWCDSSYWFARQPGSRGGFRVMVEGEDRRLNHKRLGEI